jgi:pimeloyl-ACP methyl ester carboxylesterase
MVFEISGHLVYAYCGGRKFDAARPVVVMIHGAQHDHSVWVLQSRYLAHHGFAVLALDLPGHGRSGGPVLSSVEALSDWLIEVLTQLAPQGATLVGHSMGSLIALETAARAPERVLRLALVATAYPMKVSEALLAAARDDEPRAIDMINIWSHSGSYGGFSHKPSNPGPGFCLNWGNRRLMERQDRGVLYTDFTACNAYANGEHAAARVTQPTLVVVGESDSMAAARSGRALAARIAHARVLAIAGSGHAIMGEAPDALLDGLHDFLRGAAAAAASSAPLASKQV